MRPPQIPVIEKALTVRFLNRLYFCTKRLIMETTLNIPVSFTESALQEIKRLMNEAGFDKAKQLRIGVKGGGCSGMTYLLEFDNKTDKDLSYDVDGMTFIIDPSHELYLAGMEVHWEGGLNSRGFTFKNPNASSTCGCGTSFAV
jgi:iron-sulfur cluster assembly accessory protein